MVATCTCPETFPLPTGQWKQISLPCSLGTSDTVADLFSDSGTYASDWIVFERDADNQVYTQLAETDSLSVGKGYWIKTLLASQSVSVEGGNGSTVEVPLENDSAVGRFNQVGHPFNFEVCWEDVLVVDGASTLSLAMADPLNGSTRACDETPSAAANCVMSRKAFKYNSTGASYDSFDGETMGMEGSLVTFDGFWVKAYKSGIKLRIPATPGNNCTSMAAPASPPPASVQVYGPHSDVRLAKKQSSGWFIRLIAESGELRDDGNVVGQLPDSVEGYDRHDLSEPAPFDVPSLTIVFPHPEWGEKADDYNSDFHSLQKKVKDQWEFEVVSSEPNQKVTLRWEGDPSLLKKSVLINQVTGKKFKVKKASRYSFQMDGTSHSFWWLTGRSKPKK